LVVADSEGIPEDLSGWADALVGFGAGRSGVPVGTRPVGLAVGAGHPLVAELAQANVPALTDGANASLRMTSRRAFGLVAVVSGPPFVAQASVGLVVFALSMHAGHAGQALVACISRPSGMADAHLGMHTMAIRAIGANRSVALSSGVAFVTIACHRTIMAAPVLTARQVNASSAIHSSPSDMAVALVGSGAHSVDASLGADWDGTGVELVGTDHGVVVPSRLANETAVLQANIP